MADDGFPFTTEPNALRDVVLPPSLMGKLLGSVTGLPRYVTVETWGDCGVLM